MPKNIGIKLIPAHVIDAKITDGNVFNIFDKLTGVLKKCKIGYTHLSYKLMVLYQWFSPAVLYALLSKPDIPNPIKDIISPVSIRIKLTFKQVFFTFMIFIFSPSSF
ncbi:hypothetical protein LL033_06675 [Clostridium estertheticum]|nr:hypothetical protein [Clostridium estertheticum]WAG56915.1 hypothetical protein LL033_06675 [Clostridium estertheticum]